MKLKRIRQTLLAFAVGGIPLITTATCDPYRGTFDFFRSDYDPFYYDDGVIIVDCDPYYEFCF